MENKTGTTTIALKCSDGIVLATDKRATMGYYISNKDMNKIIRIDDHLAATIAGGVGDAQMIMRILGAEAKLYKMNNGSKMPIKSAATLLGTILNNNRYYPYLVMSLVAGVVEKPEIYAIDPVGGITEEDYVATGSGSPIAIGLLESRFKKDKPIDENIKLAAKAVKVAIERDAGSGNGVNLATITSKGFKQFSDKEVEKVLEKLD